MRKIGTIITLAVALVIGGVYATFNYAENTPVAKDSQFQATVLEDADIGTPIGTIEITSNTLQLKVKNKGENVTALDTIDGELTATFTPETYAPTNIKDNGIDWGVRIEFEGVNEYEGTTVLTTTSYGTSYEKVLVGDTPSKTLTLNNANIGGLIGVTEISLPTYAEYQAYKAVLDAITIKITLSKFAAL